MILDQFRLDGLTAVVTGGTKGLGQAMARGLAQAGADLALISRNPNPDFEKEITSLGRRCVHYPADLTNRTETRKVIPDIIDELGDVNILINDAGLITREEIVDFPEEAWDSALELNLTAAFLLSQAAGRRMIKNGSGKIINVASILSFQGGLFVPSYAATKHALLGLTRSLCNAWASKGITVNAIAPGFFQTEFTEALQKDPGRSAQIIGRCPTGRWGKPEEIAGAAVFLASPASNFVNGVVLSVDGGWMAW